MNIWMQISRHCAAKSNICHRSCRLPGIAFSYLRLKIRQQIFIGIQNTWTVCDYYMLGEQDCVSTYIPVYTCELMVVLRISWKLRYENQRWVLVKVSMKPVRINTADVKLPPRQIASLYKNYPRKLVRIELFVNLYMGKYYKKTCILLYIDWIKDQSKRLIP